MGREQDDLLFDGSPYAPDHDVAPAKPKTNGQGPHMDDMGQVIIDPKAPLDTARQFISFRHVTNGLRTIHHQQSVFSKWSGTHYKALAQEEARASVYSFLESALVLEKKKPRPFKPNINHVSQVIDALRAACQLSNDTPQPSWLVDKPTNPPARDILACANGLLHIPTGRVHPHTPIFYSGTALTYDYQRDAPEPVQWLKFLKDIWADDVDSIATLQDIFGYLLGADTDQQKLFLLVGPKRSGKGTIGRIINAVIGEDAVISPTLASLQTNFGIAPLIGKTTALIADARLGSRADQHAIAERLLSISGEDRQTIDRKFLPSWNGKLGTRFIIMTNELPRIADASGALASRFIVLTMTNSFYGREDRSLTGHLLTELPGILNWALEGWRNLKTRGYFIQPTSSLPAIRDLEDLSSPMSAFVRDRCVIGAGQTAAVDGLYAAWVAWCKEQGRDHSGTKQTFGRDLRSVVPGLSTTQPREDGERERRYEGISLSQPPENADEGRTIWSRDQF